MTATGLPPRVPRRTRGWWPIWAYVIIHNLAAAATNREYLSQACARVRRQHPVLVPVFAFALIGHLMDWLGDFDVFTWAGDVINTGFDKVRRPRTL